MSAIEELEEKYPEIIDMMSPKFNSHEFILKLAQQYQQLYIQALNMYPSSNQPFQTVHAQIAKKLKKRDDLVKHIRDKPSPNIFGLMNETAVWQKIEK
ncbi:MAG: hypothetical protein ISR59_06025 [Anaerolineales bacterium]|nr:hypothetical protein [Anaerolineales bacterium]